MESNLKAALYCRLAHQDDGRIKQQLERLKRYAHVKGYNDIEIYSDNGFSANDPDRAEFSRMNADIEAGKISTVIIQSVDRIGRDIRAIALWMGKTEKKGIVVKVLDNSAKNTAHPLFRLSKIGFLFTKIHS